MRLLIFGGLLYLTGVAIILFIKPSLMFNEYGSYKHFGIGHGKDSSSYTWLPFSGFCILWAIMSYFLVVVFAENGVIPGFWVNHIDVTPASTQMKPGYYMLNTDGSGIEGVPKYVYIGPAAPGL